MPNPVAANDLQPISGSLQTSRISYGVETAGKNYGQNYNSTNWYSDIPNNGQFYTIISDNYTANYYVSRSNAGGAYVEGGLPAVDEYSAPVFWVTVGTSSLDITTVVNGLPDRVGQTPFNSGSQALNWVASSSNYFAVGPDYYEQIDADQLRLYLHGNQIISYPTTGSSWYDISGYSNNTTLYNGLGASWNSNGWFNFDGTDDYGNAGNSSNFDTNTFSIEALVRLGAADNSMRTIASRGGNPGSATNGWWLGTLRNGLGSGINEFRVMYWGTSTYLDLIASVGASNLRWHHVVATSNGTTGFFYIDGVLNTSATLPAGNLYSAGDNFLLGVDDSNGSQWTGSINNEKFYSKALTAAEVAQNYYGGPIVTGSISGSYQAGNLVSYVTGSTATYNMAANIISGSLQNGVLYNPTNGGYWSFDGTDDRILLEGSTTSAWILNSSQSWTINAWVRVPNGSSTSSGLDYQGVLSNTSGGPIHSVFQVANGSIAYSHYNNAWFTEFGTIPVNDGNWHMLTWVNQSNSMDFYIDGIYDKNVDSTMTGTGYLDVIGFSLGRAFLGDIASLQINQGKVFTAAEVLQQYNATK